MDAPRNITITLTLKKVSRILGATDQFYQTISKFNGPSYGLETNLLQCQPVTLTLKVATGIVRATRQLIMTIICAKQYFNPITNNKVMARKQILDEQTYRRTTWQLYVPMSFFGEHNKFRA